jgi:hypothetical protein
LKVPRKLLSPVIVALFLLPLVWFGLWWRCRAHPCSRFCLHHEKCPQTALEKTSTFLPFKSGLAVRRRKKTGLGQGWRGWQSFWLHRLTAGTAHDGQDLVVKALRLTAGLPVYREPATLRTQVFTCGAILGRAGRRLVLHLSQSWGGLKTRNPLLDKILSWEIPTSPKLEPAVVT